MDDYFHEILDNERKEKNCYFSLRRWFQRIEDRNSLVDRNCLEYVEKMNDDYSDHTEVEIQNNHDLYFHLERHLRNQHKAKEQK